MAAWHARAIGLKAVSFAMVGLVNSAIDFCIFWTSVTYLGWPLVPANILSWAMAVSCSFVMNIFISLGPESGHTLRLRDYVTFSASGIAGCVPRHAIRKLCARCGCEPPCPPPCRNERCSAS